MDFFDENQKRPRLIINHQVINDHKIMKEDFERLKLKPFSILIAEAGRYKRGDVLNLYHSSGLKSDTFLKRVVVDVKKGIMEGINEVEIWDLDFVEEYRGSI